MGYLNSSIADVGTVFNLSVNHTNILGQEWIIAGALLVIITIIVTRNIEKWLIIPLVAMLGLSAVEVQFDTVFYVLAIIAYIGGTITWTKINSSLDVVSTARKETQQYHATKDVLRITQNTQLAEMGKGNSGITGIVNRRLMGRTDKSVNMIDQANTRLTDRKDLTSEQKKQIRDIQVAANIKQDLRVQALRSMGQTQKTNIYEGGYVPMNQLPEQMAREDIFTNRNNTYKPRMTNAPKLTEEQASAVAFNRARSFMKPSKVENQMHPMSESHWDNYFNRNHNRTVQKTSPKYKVNLDTTKYDLAPADTKMLSLSKFEEMVRLQRKAEETINKGFKIRRKE